MSGARPWQGCSHVGTMSFNVYACSCSACGAEWHRSPGGPWRVVDPGGDREGRQTCAACGAETGAGVSACGLCGRPLGEGWEREPTVWSRVVLETPAGKLVERVAATIPLDDPDGGMRAD